MAADNYKQSGWDRIFLNPYIQDPLTDFISCLGLQCFQEHHVISFLNTKKKVLEHKGIHGSSSVANSGHASVLQCCPCCTISKFKSSSCVLSGLLHAKAQAPTTYSHLASSCHASYLVLNTHHPKKSVEKRNNSASPFPTCAVSMGMAHHPCVRPSQGQGIFREYVPM